MNVKELKEMLVDLPDDMEVMMSSDEEGNRFHPLAEVARSAWCGEDPIHPDDIAEYYDEGEEIERVVILWP